VAWRCKGTGELGKAEAAEGSTRERMTGLRKRVRRPRRAGQPSNGIPPLTESLRPDLIQARATSRRIQARVLARARARVRRKGSGRAAERGHGQRQGGRPAGKRNRRGVGHWEKEEGEKETLARGAMLPERERGKSGRPMG
jgi:hypothetical protein